MQPHTTLFVSDFKMIIRMNEIPVWKVAISPAGLCYAWTETEDQIVSKVSASEVGYKFLSVLKMFF